MLKKKQKIRAPPSYKNKCQNCHILNMTVYKKASPNKQSIIESQQKFEKLIDEQVFSDDEEENELDKEIEVNESMTYSVKNSSFMTISDDHMSICSSMIRQKSRQQKQSVVCPNCLTR